MFKNKILPICHCTYDWPHLTHCACMKIGPLVSGDMAYDTDGELKCWMLTRCVVFTVWSWENICHLEAQKVGFWNAWSERKASKTYSEAGQEEVLLPSDSIGGEACVTWDITH